MLQGFLEAFAHQPNLGSRHPLQALKNAEVFLIRCFAQLTHLSENYHLFGIGHQTEIVECCSHAGGVGVIGINNQVVSARV